MTGEVKEKTRGDKQRIAMERRGHATRMAKETRGEDLRGQAKEMRRMALR